MSIIPKKFCRMFWNMVNMTAKKLKKLTFSDFDGHVLVGTFR